LAGEVVTWDIHNRLIKRPVQRGQVLVRVADPDGPWQLEVYMPENHMGHVANYQEQLFEKSREELRKVLTDEQRAKLGEAAPQEDVEKAVNAELEKTPNDLLSERLAAIYLKRLRDGIAPIAKDVTDEQLRTKLIAVADAKTYSAACEKLGAIIKDLQSAAPSADDAKPQAAVTPTEAPNAEAAKPQAAATQADTAADATKPQAAATPLDTSGTGAAKPQAATTSADTSNAEGTKPQAVAPSPNADLLAKLTALPHGAVPDERLEVSYILATEPGTTRKGIVSEIHRSAEVRGDEGNTVLIKVALNKDEMERLRDEKKLRPGATVTAKVYCGRRSLGYVLLHDLISFIQSRVLFKFF
jgi:hypothetical protein